MTPKGDSPNARGGRSASDTRGDKRGIRDVSDARGDRQDIRGARVDKQPTAGGKREYRSDKRESDAAKTRVRIVAAAAKHLRSAKGIKGLSLESVAKEAGVTRLTVYKQFGSRHGLLEAVFDDVARRGGLHRIPEAMAERDPRVALQRLVAIFCEFWYFNSKTLGQIIGASTADPQLEHAILARNERRRKALATLLNRIAGANRIPPETFDEVVDTLFVLTSHAVFSGLAVAGRSVETVCRLVQDLAIRTVDRLEV
jgi:AcrR family transcriptional regulator